LRLRRDASFCFFGETYGEHRDSAIVKTACAGLMPVGGFFVVIGFFEGG
jgi:hypothetical protein